MEVRRKQQLGGSGIRQFSTTRWKAKRVNAELLDVNEGELLEEMEERMFDAPATEALQTLLHSGDQQKQKLALRLYAAIPDHNITSNIQADLLEYLSAPGAQIDANQILPLFDALPRADRRASSYRTAISAYLSLDLVGPAVQLHQEAASSAIGVDIGTDAILGHTIKHNQWERSLQVIKAFISCSSRNGVDMPSISQKLNLHNGDRDMLWGIVAQLPYLRGNLASFLLHVQQFHHELNSTDEIQEALNHLLFGLAAETTEQVLNTEPVDEDVVWDFLLGFFQELRTYELPRSRLYEYVIRRMVQIPRYRQYTNKRKAFLQLYQWYRSECIQDLNPQTRPSRNLLRALITHVGHQRSTIGSSAGVENLISDMRLFYPGEPLSSGVLKYLINYYAESGEVDKLNEHFKTLCEIYEPRPEVNVLIHLVYAYARRVDVQAAEKQFQLISEEFERTPDAACWNVLLLAHTRADDLDGSLDCFNRLLEAGATPDIYTFGPLLDLCAARGDVEAFEALYSRAEHLNIPIRTDAKARAGYVQALLEFDDVDGAEATAKAMLRSYRAGVLKGSLTHTWNLLIQHYALRGDVASSRRLYRQMVENNIPLDSWTYGSLMRAFVEVKQTNAAYKILRVTMPSNNVQVHAFHYALVITGFLREGQYREALHANARMLDRNVVQTTASRMASIQAIGLAEMKNLKSMRDKDPRTKLVALERQMRDIIFSDFESDVANRQPRHRQLIDSKEHSTAEGYFGFLILLYGTRGAYNICKELFEAAAVAREDKTNHTAPLSLLVAIMEAQYRAGEHDEVANCWELARTQANKLVKTLNQFVDPAPPKVEFDSLLDPSIKESFDSARIAANRRQVLVRAARIYIRSLLAREDDSGIQEAQRTIRSLLTGGFVVDNLTWNEFIQMLATRGRIIDAFSACEAYLMPAFSGWRSLNPSYIRKNQPGHLWMELRSTDIDKGALMPRYKTLVVLAKAFVAVRRDEENGVGWIPEMGAWTREVLEKMAGNTVRAVETMPRTGDRLQRKYLGGML
jgi:pentatricopeptide repeat-containing protein PET309